MRQLRWPAYVARDMLDWMSSWYESHGAEIFLRPFRAFYVGTRVLVVGSRFVRGAYVIVTWRDGDDKGINTPWVAFISRVQASR